MANPEKLPYGPGLEIEVTERTPEYSIGQLVVRDAVGMAVITDPESAILVEMLSSRGYVKIGERGGELRLGDKAVVYKGQSHHFEPAGGASAVRLKLTHRPPYNPQNIQNTLRKKKPHSQ